MSKQFGDDRMDFERAQLPASALSEVSMNSTKRRLPQMSEVGGAEHGTAGTEGQGADINNDTFKTNQTVHLKDYYDLEIDC